MVPIGGLGEIGMNMSILEIDGKIIIIDCGQTLPDDSLPGVDLVVPDVSFLVKRQKDILGIVITHGHEDHIGGLSYLAPKLGSPTIHAPAFASEIIRRRFKETQPSPQPQIKEYDHTSRLKLGPFEIHPIRVTHSMPNCFALGINTPLGWVVWTGDFKIDPNGSGDDIFDLHAFARLSEKGVFALFIDSTNAHEDGVAGHEIDLIEPIARHFYEAEGTIFFSTFGSSVHRMQTVFDIAAEMKKKVLVAGRSMRRNVEIATNRGFLDVEPGIIMQPKEFQKVHPERQVVLCTGSQGEPMSALSRLSRGDHPKLEVMPGDTVLMSARMIPGNEKTIYRMVNHFHRREARVVTSQDAKIHCSGHAKRMEIKQLMALCRPKHVIPIHGELRHLRANRENALDLDIPENRIHVLDRGDVLHLTPKAGKMVDHFPISRVLVDGRRLDGVEDLVIRDRQHLAEDGMLVVILAADSANGELLQDPEIVTRGFVLVDDNDHIIEECKEAAAAAFEELEVESREEASVISNHVRKALKSHIRRKYDRYPVILPLVLDL
jgi:ribonuclease J